jgi:hypothetical protein
MADLGNHFNFRKIDDIFYAWCQQFGTKYNPRQILPRETYGSYKYQDIEWLFTLFDKDFDGSGTIRNIKLANDGFIYNAVPFPATTIARHGKIHGWNCLKDLLPELPLMQGYFAEHCGENRETQLWYNFEKERIDVECKGEAANILVTFEKGYPYEDRKFSPARHSRNLGIRRPQG